MRPNGKKLRLTHPNLYGAFMVLAIMTVALGLNFIFKTPSFNPFNIPKGTTGVLFLIVGVTEMILLNMSRRLGMTRSSMVAGVALHLFWGVILALAALVEKATSYQLPIYVLGVVGLAYFLVIEPHMNPLTDKNEKGGQK